MKRFTTIFLLILFAQITTAQIISRDPTARNTAGKVIFAFTGSIITDAIGDGITAEGYKVAGHSLQAMSVGFLLPLPAIFDIKRNSFGWFLASYVCFRVSLFDPVYNASRGLPFSHIGNCSLWDKGLNAFDPPAWMLNSSRVLVLSIAIKIPLDHF